jgi:phosphatidylserine decarboxylase
MRPDRAGLSGIYVALESGARALGMRLATGGLGPRLELLSEPGDAVRLGRQIGILRLGGWCDLYVPEGARITAWPGQTLIGSETVLASFEPDPRAESPEEATAAETPAAPAQTASSSKPRAKSRAKPKPKAKASAKPRAKAPQTAEPVSEAKAEPEPGAAEDDLAERLARLRETAGGGDIDLDPEAD